MYIAREEQKECFRGESMAKHITSLHLFTEHHLMACFYQLNQFGNAQTQRQSRYVFLITLNR